MQVQEEVVMIKGKRTKRPRPASPLALTMATSSSNTAEISGGVGFGGGGGGGVISDVTGSNSDIRVATSASDSGEFTQSTDEEEEDMANCLILLANGQSQKSSQSPVAAAANKATLAVELYQCKTCNKSFSSFQALGGHRASHKKPNKPITTEERKASVRDIHKPENILSNHTILSLQLSNNRVFDGNTHPQNKSRVHECSMCGAEFASGQALGGHMRRHRPIPTASTNSHGESQEAAKEQKNLLSLDLNLPAPEDDHHRESKFPFTPKEQVIVFSNSPLIDCQY